MARERRADSSVFEDLGFSPDHAERLRIRSELAWLVRRELKNRGLNQTQGAALFGVTQPRLSDLLRGKINQFSIDALVSMLAHAGIPISVGVSEPEIELESPLIHLAVSTTAGAAARSARQGSASFSTSFGTAFAASMGTSESTMASAVDTRLALAA